MKAIHLKTGKEVEYWIVSHQEVKPKWIEHEFYIGKMGWITEYALRYGWISIRGESYRLNVGDVFIYDGKEIKFLSPEKFERGYSPMQNKI